MIAWLIAHPETLAAAVLLLRVVYALASRLVTPYPRARAVVEALAALGPDVLRAAQQFGSAVLGRPLPSLEVRAPDEDLLVLRARVAELERELAARRNPEVQ